MTTDEFSHGTNLIVRQFRRLAVQSSCEPTKNIERFRVKEVPGQIFLPVENSFGAEGVIMC